MKRALLGLGLALGAVVVVFAQGPLTPFANLMVRATDGALNITLASSSPSSTAPLQTGANVMVRATNGALNVACADCGGSAAGNDTEVQYNDNGDFGASSKLTFTASTGILKILGQDSSHVGSLVLAKGDDSCSNSFSFNGPLSLEGCVSAIGAPQYISGGGNTPTPTCSTNCGTSPSVEGGDSAMVITMGATGSPASGFIITFDPTWNAAPVCVAQMAKTGMVSGKAPLTVVTTTSTATVVTNGTAPANNDVYAMQCMGTS